MKTFLKKFLRSILSSVYTSSRSARECGLPGELAQFG